MAVPGVTTCPSYLSPRWSSPSPHTPGWAGRREGGQHRGATLSMHMSMSGRQKPPGSPCVGAGRCVRTWVFLPCGVLAVSSADATMSYLDLVLGAGF